MFIWINEFLPSNPTDFATASLFAFFRSCKHFILSDLLIDKENFFCQFKPAVYLNLLNHFVKSFLRFSVFPTKNV